MTIISVDNWLRQNVDLNNSSPARLTTFFSSSIALGRLPPLRHMLGQTGCSTNTNKFFRFVSHFSAHVYQKNQTLKNNRNSYY